jgi:hypothetical protein
VLLARIRAGGGVRPDPKEVISVKVKTSVKGGGVLIGD